MADNTNVIDNTETGIDVAYLFRQIAAIQEQTEYLNMAIEKLSQMDDGDSGAQYSPGNISGKAKAEALGNIVRCRETTNQQLLRFYETVYNDLKSGCFGGSSEEAPKTVLMPAPETLRPRFTENGM